MLRMQTNNSQLPTLESDLIRKYNEKIRQAQDLHDLYERRLYRADRLCKELSVALSHVDKVDYPR